MGCSEKKNNKIELTCFEKESSNGISYNLTIIPPSKNENGNVYLNDKNLDSESGGSKQEISNLTVSQSVISWRQKFEVSNSNIKSSQSIEITRNTGLLKRTEFLLTPEITYTYSQCEPRNLNKF